MNSERTLNRNGAKCWSESLSPLVLVRDRHFHTMCTESIKKWVKRRRRDTRPFCGFLLALWCLLSNSIQTLISSMHSVDTDTPHTISTFQSSIHGCTSHESAVPLPPSYIRSSEAGCRRHFGSNNESISIFLFGSCSQLLCRNVSKRWCTCADVISVNSERTLNRNDAKCWSESLSTLALVRDRHFHTMCTESMKNG